MPDKKETSKLEYCADWCLPPLLMITKLEMDADGDALVGAKVGKLNATSSLPMLLPILDSLRSAEL